MFRKNIRRKNFLRAAKSLTEKDHLMVINIKLKCYCSNRMQLPEKKQKSIPSVKTFPQNAKNRLSTKI